MQKSVRNNSFLNIKKGLLKCLQLVIAASHCSDYFIPDPLDTVSRVFTSHLAESKEDKCCILTAATGGRDTNAVF